MMGRASTHLGTARKKLAQLQEALAIERPSALEPDGAVQRFKYTFEAVWKAAEYYLLEVESLSQFTQRRGKGMP